MLARNKGALRKPDDEKTGGAPGIRPQCGTDASMMMSTKARARTGKSGRSRWRSARPRISRLQDANLTDREAASATAAFGSGGLRGFDRGI